MAILASLQSAMLRVEGRKADTFFGSSGVTEMEMCDLINEVAEDVAAYQDWQRLVKITTITASGADAFDLPADYQRQLVNADVQDLNNWVWGYNHLTDINDFLYMQQRGVPISPGCWIIYGGQMHFTPAPSGSATFPYISSFYAYETSALTYKAAFTADTDTFLLPERLLTLGLVWRWRELKKLDFTGDQEAFAKALSEYATKDAGSRVQRYGGSNRGGIWPWRLA